MNARELVNACAEAGIKPLQTRQEHGLSARGEVRSLDESKASKHGFSREVVLAQLEAEYEFTAAGTHDGIRDGEHTHRTRNVRWVYFDLAELKAAGILGNET